jgi:two-component system phosphate regulon sensor histidine kinase PhoR
MNKKITILISIITSFALIGIVVVQLLWVNYALELRTEIFDKRVQIFLKDIVSFIIENENITSDSTNCPFSESCSKSQSCTENFIKIHNIDTKRLDSIMYGEFCNRMKVNEDYVYGIIDKESDTLLTCSNTNYYSELYNTYHTFPIPCHYKKDSKLLGIYFPNQKNYILNRMIFLLIISSLFLIVVITSFIWTILILLRQKKLSEVKSDFVNNMTHEFKTPIATISLASEMLSKPSVMESKDKLMQYANIIFDENNRLKSQVEQVLQISVLDKKEFKLLKKDIDLHEIIENVADNFQLVIQQQNGKIKLELNAEPFHIFADPIHVYNIISNLTDNAIKYSFDITEVTITTKSTNNGILIMVEDKGIGISAEHLKQVFKKLYRIPTGNLHDVKGFGLGLYYVKTMVEAHGGRIKLKSELKKGSTFEIFFPYNHNINIH